MTRSFFNEARLRWPAARIWYLIKSGTNATHSGQSEASALCDWQASAQTELRDAFIGGACLQRSMHSTLQQRCFEGECIWSKLERERPWGVRIWPAFFVNKSEAAMNTRRLHPAAQLSYITGFRLNLGQIFCSFSAGFVLYPTILLSSSIRILNFNQRFTQFLY